MKRYLKKKFVRRILSLALTGILALAIIVSNSSAAKAQRVQDTTLRVGQKAPPFQVYQWLKGSPVSLEKGHIYVVEFTSVFCGPCRVNIPHIAKLARDYQGKATFISAYVFESRNYLADPSDKKSLTSDYTSHVKKFIHSQGSQFDDIHVALDDPGETIANNWMFAAGNRGVPVAYVIDRQGTIVWMGEAVDLDPVIKQVTEGNFDPQAAMRKIADKKAAVNRMQMFFKEGDTSRAFAILDGWIADNPKNLFHYEEKFKSLLNIDEPRAYAYGRELLNNQCRDAETVLQYMTADIIYKDETEGNKLIARDYDLAIDFADRVFAIGTLETAKAGSLDAKARCFFLKGENKKAVQIEREAIVYLKKHCDMGDASIRSYESSFKTNLEEYSKKLASR